MQNVSIEKLTDSENCASALNASIEKTAELVRQRAFGHFLQRGCSHGNDVEDWVRAERELIWAPPAELTENDREIVLQVQASGLKPANIQITATPESILVESEVVHKHEESNGSVRFCEFSEKLFRRFDLPALIDVDQVSANLDLGILRIVASKAQATQNGHSVPLAASASAQA